MCTYSIIEKFVDEIVELADSDALKDEDVFSIANSLAEDEMKEEQMAALQKGFKALFRVR